MIGSIFKDTSSCQFKRKGDIFLHIANQVRTPATRVKKTKDIRINKSKTWSWEKLFWTFYTKIAIHKQPLGNNLTLNKKTNFDFWHCSSPTEQTWNYSVCPSWLCPCRKWAKLPPTSTYYPWCSRLRAFQCVANHNQGKPNSQSQWR